MRIGLGRRLTAEQNDPQSEAGVLRPWYSSRTAGVPPKDSAATLGKLLIPGSRVVLVGVPCRTLDGENPYRPAIADSAPSVGSSSRVADAVSRAQHVEARALDGLQVD